jgi:hypothetical protein
MNIDHYTINTLRALANQCADDDHTSAGVQPAVLMSLLDAFEERDAMAAHVELLRAALIESTLLVENDLAPALEGAGELDEDIAGWKALLSYSPTASLARRYLINQAEGAELVRDRLREKANNARSQARQQDSAFYHRCANVAANKASDLRQQAEGHQ